jgi:nicotinamide riboside transporter PnuC
MIILMFLMFCYFGASGGAFLFWLIGLGLVVVRILKTTALPWCAVIGTVVGVLTVIAASMNRSCYYEPHH